MDYNNLFNKQKFLLNKYKHDFQKIFGQNFLIDNNYSRLLIESANLSPEDIVVEVGTGFGAITEHLSRLVKQVISFDIDKRCHDIFKIEFKNIFNVTLINDDILSYYNFYPQVIHKIPLDNNKVDTLISKKNQYKVVSSLPYNISKKIIKLFLNQEYFPESMTLIIQDEVARNYSARPPKATFLSNMVNLYGSCEYIAKVPREAFYPMPKVNGGIIHIKLDSEKVRNLDEKLVNFIKLGFSSPRKTISNVLASGLHLEKQEILDTLEGFSLSQNLRAENLTLKNWKSLYDKITR